MTSGSPLPHREPSRPTSGTSQRSRKQPREHEEEGFDSPRLSGVFSAHGQILRFTCGFSHPVGSAGPRCASLAADRVCTQRVPLASVRSGR